MELKQHKSDHRRFASCAVRRALRAASCEPIIHFPRPTEPTDRPMCVGKGLFTCTARRLHDVR